jgi:hypothetical protein
MPYGLLPIGGSWKLLAGYQPASRTAARITVQRSSARSKGTSTPPAPSIAARIGGAIDATVKITDGRPAREAAEAIAAPWLPDDDAVTTSAPTLCAWATATRASRSLYDQVGGPVSSFSSRLVAPIAAPARGNGSSGVGSVGGSATGRFGPRLASGGSA